MGSKRKMTVSLDESLVRELTGMSERGRVPKSRLVEDALRFWKRSRLEQELREGYKAMEAEDRETAEERLQAAHEAGR